MSPMWMTRFELGASSARKVVVIREGPWHHPAMSSHSAVPRSVLEVNELNYLSDRERSTILAEIKKLQKKRFVPPKVRILRGYWTAPISGAVTKEASALQPSASLP